MSTQELALVPQEPQAVAIPQPDMPADALALIARAIDTKADVATMKEMLAMRKELIAEQAKRAFDAALADFQSECPIIQKKKAGAKNAYRYAPLDDIVLQVRHLIRKHGFSFTITAEVDQGWVKALCKITHCQGHSEVSEFKVPVDNKNPMMSDPQRYGGAITFAKRYAFANGFGILTSDEDNDGRVERPQAQGPKRATDRTRQWMLEGLRDIHRQLQAYGIDKAIIMPDQSLEDWPLEDVPMSKEELAELRRKVEAHA